MHICFLALNNNNASTRKTRHEHMRPKLCPVQFTAVTTCRYECMQNCILTGVVEVCRRQTGVRPSSLSMKGKIKRRLGGLQVWGGQRAARQIIHNLRCLNYSAACTQACCRHRRVSCLPYLLVCVSSRRSFLILLIRDLLTGDRKNITAKNKKINIQEANVSLWRIL